MSPRPAADAACAARSWSCSRSLSGSTCDCVHLALAPPAPLAVRTAPGRPTCREGSGPVTRSQHGSTGHTYGIMSCTRPHMRHRMGRKLRPDARLLGWALGPRAHTQDTTHTHTSHPNATRRPPLPPEVRSSAASHRHCRLRRGHTSCDRPSARIYAYARSTRPPTHSRVAAIMLLVRTVAQ